MNKKLIDLIDLSSIVDVYQKIEISYEDDGAASYIGTIEGCPMSLATKRIVMLEAVDYTLKIILAEE